MELLYNRQVEAVQPGEGSAVALGVVTAAGVQVLICLDEGFPCILLLGRCEGTVLCEEDIATAVGYVNQVVDLTIAVEVIAIDIADFRAAGEYAAQGDFRSTTHFASVVDAVVDEAHHAVAQVVVCEGSFEVVLATDSGCVCLYGATNRLEVSGHAVGIAEHKAKTVHGRPFYLGGERVGITFVRIRIRQDESIRDSRVEEASRRQCTTRQSRTWEAGTGIRAGEVAVGLAQVGIEVAQATQRLVIQTFDGKYHAEWQFLIHGEVVFPEGRILQIFFGSVDDVRRQLGDVRGSRCEAARIRRKRKRRGVGDVDDGRVHPVVPQLVGYQYLWNTRHEDTRTAPDLGRLVAFHIVVEAHPRRKLQVCLGEGTRIDFEGEAFFVPEVESAYYGVVEIFCRSIVILE